MHAHYVYSILLFVVDRLVVCSIGSLIANTDERILYKVYTTM